MSRIRKIIGLQFAHSPLAFVLGIAVALVPVLSGIALLGVSGWFITVAAAAGAGAAVGLAGGGALIRWLALARTVGRYGERLLTHDATFRFLADLRSRIFRYYASRPSGQVVRRSGAVLNRLTTDIAALDTIYLRLVAPGVVAAAVAVGLLTYFGLLGLPMLIAAGGLVAVCLFGLTRAVTVSGRKTARRLDAASEAVRLRTVDLVAGRKDLAVYGGLEEAADKISKAEDRLVAAETIEERRSVRLLVLASFAGQAFLAVVLVAGIWLVGNGNLGLAAFAGALLAAFALPEVISALVPGLAKAPRVGLAARRVSSSVAVDQLSSPINRQAEGAPVASAPVLRFDRVTFAYSGADRPVLENLSLSVARGEVLALTGRSGRGKSTVAALAAGLLQPQAGRVQVNGIDLGVLPEEDLRTRVTVISQRPYLFNDTIAANLRIANPMASEADLWRALDASALSSRIRAGDKGLETLLGEGGLGLSGGEQRRLGLARAYLTDPDLFILDEMTEGLDEATAMDVMERFDRFRRNAAVLLIAHKAHEIERADRVFSLSESGICLAAE